MRWRKVLMVSWYRLPQLAFQCQQRQGIAQRVALQAGRVAFQGTDQGAVAVAQVEVAAAVNIQGAWRVAHQQAANQAGHGGLTHLAGAGQLVDQYGGLEYRAQRDQLLLGRAHCCSSLLLQGSATSITPPPRHTSPS